MWVSPGLVKIFSCIGHSTGYTQALPQRACGHIHKLLLLSNAHMHASMSHKITAGRCYHLVKASLTWTIISDSINSNISHGFKSELCIRYSQVWGVPPAWSPPDTCSWVQTLSDSRSPAIWRRAQGPHDPVNRTCTSVNQSQFCEGPNIINASLL